MWRTRDSNRKRCHATELSFKPGLAQILQTPCRYWTPETFAHGLPGYDLYASLLFLAHWMCATPHDAPPPKCPCRVSTAANQTTERRSRIGCRLRRNLVFVVLKNWDWAYDRPCGHVNAMPAASCNHFVTSLFKHRLSPSTRSPDGASGFPEWSSSPISKARIIVAHGGIRKPLVHLRRTSRH